MHKFPVFGLNFQSVNGGYLKRKVYTLLGIRQPIVIANSLLAAEVVYIQDTYI